jgi:hypothetical protein
MEELSQGGEPSRFCLRWRKRRSARSARKARPPMAAPTPIPAFAPVERPEWEEEVWMDVGDVLSAWVEVAAGVEVVVDEVVGLGGGEVSKRFRRLGEC